MDEASAGLRGAAPGASCAATPHLVSLGVPGASRPATQGWP